MTHDEKMQHWLKTNLERQGRSQADLARYLNMNVAVVNRIMHGERKLRTDELAKVIEFFGVRPYFLPLVQGEK